MRRFPFMAVVITAALIAAVFLILERVDLPKDEPASPRPPRREAPDKAPRGKKTGRAAEPAPSRAAPPGRTVAVIIDDIGYDLRTAQELAGIPAPIAFAVLPHAPHAAESARLLHAAGKEILLHLPMEPHAYPEESPGAGALMVGMDGAEIRRQIREALATVPFASGVNNHMGSRFMEDRARLAVVMQELRNRGLYFVDSRTTPDSRAMETAGEAGVPFVSRDLFIDHAPGYAAALESLTGSIRQRNGNGAPLLMIGHPHPQTLRALRDALAVWRSEGVRIAPVPACLRTSGRPGGEDRPEKRTAER